MQLSKRRFGVTPNLLYISHIFAYVEVIKQRTAAALEDIDSFTDLIFFNFDVVTAATEGNIQILCCVETKVTVKPQRPAGVNPVPGGASKLCIVSVAIFSRVQLLEGFPYLVEGCGGTTFSIWMVLKRKRAVRTSNFYEFTTRRHTKNFIRACH